jgi:GH25 family lysozyme M1 (1,4-beta-N-acetylmuramidase)
LINNKVVLTDISFWNDDNTTPQKVDFVKMKESGIDGVIIRLGQNTWLDPDYLDYVNGANSAGLPYGFYWFWDSRSSPASQAKMITDTISVSDYPPLFIWSDYEENYGGQYSGIKNFAAFVGLLESKYTDKTVGIYTGPSYWIENSTEAFRVWASSRPLWIAHYGVDVPDVPNNWDSYLIWQYTDNGDGLAHGSESKNIDMNYFYGTMEDFIRTFNLDNTESGGESTMVKYTGTVKSTATPYLNIREQPGTTYPIVIKVAPGGTVTGEGDLVVSGGYSWMKITSANGVATSGWAASEYLSYTITEEPTNPPTGETLPTYFIAYDDSGKSLGKYVLEA